MSKPQLKKDFWEELDLLLKEPDPPENSITAFDYADKEKIPLTTAKHRLNNLVQQNKLKKIKFNRKSYYYL